MKRRHVVKQIAAMPFVVQSSLSGMAWGQKKLKQFGVQLSTITQVMSKDFAGALKQVGEIGYRQVEFSALGYLGRDVQEVKDLLDKYDLEAPVGRVAFNVPANFNEMSQEERIKIFSSQGSIDSLVDRIKRSVEECKIMGQKYVIIPAIMPHVFSDMDQIKNMLQLLKEASKMCLDEGVMLGYHNHSWEFEEVDGSIPYEMMLNELSPENFTFQLDTYWIRKANRDLSMMLEKYSGRFITCHLKDMDGEGDFEDVGQGEIDFPDFILQAQKQGAKYFFVERDTSDDPMMSIKKSFDYLQNMRY